MAKKSIILAETTLVEKVTSHTMPGKVAYPDEIKYFTNYQLNEEVLSWCWNNIGYCKFNTRKGRIKFENEADAILFKLVWM